MKTHPPLTTEHAKEFYEGATRFLNPDIRRVPRFDYQNLPDIPLKTVKQVFEEEEKYR